MTDSITTLYAYVCGQGRGFAVDGVVLPVCQRCLGLYVGAALTGVWLLGSGLWRRGLPSRRLWPIQAGVLLIAMLAGLHVVDAGPAWRVLCGLWTGHVVVLWLSGGARHLRHAVRRVVPSSLVWAWRDLIQAVVAIVLLPGLACIMPELLPIGWHAWTAVVIAGGLLLAALAVNAISAVVIWVAAKHRRRSSETLRV